MSDRRTPLGAKIRQLRKQAGLTQKKLAVKMGLAPTSQTQVSEWETGKTIPLYETCRRIEEVIRDEGVQVEEGVLTGLAAVHESRASYGSEGREPLRPVDADRWPPEPDAHGSQAEQWMWEVTEGSPVLRGVTGRIGWREMFRVALETAHEEEWPQAELEKLVYFRRQYLD